MDRWLKPFMDGRWGIVTWGQARGRYNRYSPALREAVATSGRTPVFSGLRIPRSTRHHWIRHGLPKGGGAPHGGYGACGALALASSLPDRLVEVLASIVAAIATGPDPKGPVIAAMTRLRDTLTPEDIDALRSVLPADVVRRLRRSQVPPCSRADDG